MKKLRSLATLTVLVSIAVILCPMESSFARLNFTFVSWDIEPLTALSGNAPSVWRLTVEKKLDCCVDLDFTMSTKGEIVYQDEPAWTAHLDSGVTYQRDLHFQLPAATDTCSFKLSYRCGCGGGADARTLVVEPDTVRVYEVLPQPDRHPRPKPTGRRGDVVPGEFPLRDSLYGIPDRAKVAVFVDSTDMICEGRTPAEWDEYYQQRRGECLTMSLSPLGEVLTDSPTKWLLSVEPAVADLNCPDTVMVVMFGVGLTTGTKSRKVPITSDGRTELEVELLIPSPDTCEVKFSILSRGHPKCSRVMTYTFTAVQDTIVLYAVPPANLPRSRAAPRTAPARSPLSHVIPGEFPEDDSLYGIPEPPPEDPSKRADFITVAIPQSDIDKHNRMISQRPNHRDTLSALRADTPPGGTPFDLEAYLDAGEDEKFPVCMDLRGADKRSWAEGLLGELTGEQVEPGFYHMEVSKKNIELLRKSGVVILFLSDPPHKHLKPLNESDSGNNSDSELDKASRSTLFNESSGSDWYSRWLKSDDSNAYCGMDTWDALSYGRMWCVGDGSYPFESIYDCGMNSYLLSNSIYVGGLPSLWLSLDMKYDQNDGFTTTTVYVVDSWGYNYWVHTWPGSNGWTWSDAAFHIDLTSIPGDWFRVQFQFLGSNSPSGRGFSMDNLSVYTMLPNLAAWQPDWDTLIFEDSIVVSPHTGTYDAGCVDL